MFDGEAVGSGAPAIPWVESDRLAEHLVSISADEETTRFATDLARDGLAIIDFGDARTAELVDSAVRETDPYFGGFFTRVQDAWRESEAVKRLATHPKVLRLLKAAYGREPFAFQTLNFQRGSQQSLHSDAFHFHSEPPRFMCGVWFALEDITARSRPFDLPQGQPSPARS